MTLLIDEGVFLIDKMISSINNHLFTEADLDTYVKNVRNIASDDFTVQLVQ